MENVSEGIAVPFCSDQSKRRSKRCVGRGVGRTSYGRHMVLPVSPIIKQCVEIRASGAELQG